MKIKKKLTKKIKERTKFLEFCEKTEKVVWEKNIPKKLEYMKLWNSYLKKKCARIFPKIKQGLLDVKNHGFDWITSEIKLKIKIYLAIVHKNKDFYLENSRKS